MGTKNDPGEFDCYAAAEPDEPMFVLLARDRTASKLVSIWSALRDERWDVAREVFDVLLADLQRRPRAPNRAKAAEAWQCALEMARWRLEVVKRQLAEAKAQVLQ